MKCKFYHELRHRCEECGLKSNCIRRGCAICKTPISVDERSLELESASICSSCLEQVDAEILRKTLLVLVDAEYDYDNQMEE